MTSRLTPLPQLLVGTALALTMLTACSSGSGSSSSAAGSHTGTPTTSSTPATPTTSSTPASAADRAAHRARLAHTAQRARAAKRRKARHALRLARAARAARTARRRAAANPLADRPMGVYKGDAEPSWGPYAASRGEDHTLLGKIALRPKARWFTDRTSPDAIAGQVRDYIANAQAGNPDALVQLVVFRMQPWEGDACHRLPTRAEQASYRQWIDNFAGAVGDAPAAIILQPDGPFALCVPHHSPLPSSLIGYSAHVLGALPNASVYLDAGAADWPAAGQGGVSAALDFLIPDGVADLRGVALNSTHYSSVTDEVARGSAIVEALAARGIAGKHFVVNTSSDGRPFVFGDYHGPDPDNASVCRSPSDQACVTLGIPPTTDVAAPAWGLSAQTNALASRYADGYLWFGRPWLYRQASPFDRDRALDLARTTPY